MAGLALSCDVWASPRQIEQLEAAISEREQRIQSFRAEQQELQQNILAAETELQQLQNVIDPAEAFDAQNLAVGLRYDMSQWRARLRQRQLDINALQQATIRDKQSLAELQMGDEPAASNTPEELAAMTADANAEPAGLQDLQAIRRQQQILIQQSYELAPAAAALYQARARSLEPIAGRPVLGEQAVLLSEDSSTLQKNVIGIMQHTGGNQYYLKAILTPGKQAFVIGGYRFPQVVPEEYAGAACIVLLNIQDRRKPVLQYFPKEPH